MTAMETTTLKLTRLAAIALCTLSRTACGAAFHVDDFQSGASTLGWEGGSTPTYMADGGPAGAGDAFIQISAFGYHLATKTDAPEWMGDYTSIGASKITVDLMSPPSSDPLPIRVVLFGPTTTGNRWTSTVAQTIPDDGVWRNYTFSLASSDLTSVLGDATYSQLMGGVVRVMLRFDP